MQRNHLMGKCTFRTFGSFILLHTFTGSVLTILDAFMKDEEEEEAGTEEEEEEEEEEGAEAEGSIGTLSGLSASVDVAVPVRSIDLARFLGQAGE